MRILLIRLAVGGVIGFYITMWRRRRSSFAKAVMSIFGETITSALVHAQAMIACGAKCTRPLLIEQGRMPVESVRIAVSLAGAQPCCSASFALRCVVRSIRTWRALLWQSRWGELFSNPKRLLRRDVVALQGEAKRVSNSCVDLVLCGNSICSPIWYAPHAAHQCPSPSWTRRWLSNIYCETINVRRMGS